MGSFLDLPHYKCNSVYVPWQSKGQRVTMTLRNNNGRSSFDPSPAVVSPLDCAVIVPHHAMGLSGLHGATFLPSTVGMVTRGIDRNTPQYSDPSPSPPPRLRIDTKLEDGMEDRQANKRRRSMGSEAYPAHEGHLQGSGSFLSSTSYLQSPGLDMCNGWCGYNVLAHRTAVSLFDFSCCAGELTLCVSVIVVRVFRPATCLGRSSGFANEGVMQVSR